MPLRVGRPATTLPVPYLPVPARGRDIAGVLVVKLRSTSPVGERRWWNGYSVRRALRFTGTADSGPISRVRAANAWVHSPPPGTTSRKEAE